MNESSPPLQVDARRCVVNTFQPLRPDLAGNMRARRPTVRVIDSIWPDPNVANKMGEMVPMRRSPSCAPSSGRR